MISMKGALVCAFTTFATMAQAVEVYECDLGSRGNDGMISQVLVLLLDREKSTGAAYDGMIHAVHGDPIPVNLKIRNNKTALFNWKLQGVPLDDSSTGLATYNAALNLQTLRVNVRAVLHGWENNTHGSGKCKLAK